MARARLFETCLGVMFETTNLSKAPMPDKAKRVVGIYLRQSLVSNNTC